MSLKFSFLLKSIYKMWFVSFLQLWFKNVEKKLLERALLGQIFLGILPLFSEIFRNVLSSLALLLNLSIHPSFQKPLSFLVLPLKAY